MVSVPLLIPLAQNLLLDFAGRPVKERLRLLDDIIVSLANLCAAQHLLDEWAAVLAH